MKKRVVISLILIFSFVLFSGFVYAGVGDYSSIAVDSNNKIHISHYDNINKDLRYCNNVAGSWSCEIVDSEGDVGRSTTIAIDSNNKVHIAHSDLTNNKLRYCNNVAGSWSCVVVDNARDNTGKNSIAIDSNNKVYISHHDEARFRYCNNVAGSWSCQLLDYQNYAERTMSSIAIDSNNKVYIAHQHRIATDGTLSETLRYCNNVAGSWSCSNVDVVGNLYRSLGNQVSIALDSNNKVYISHYDVTEKSTSPENYQRGLKYCNNLAGWSCSFIESNNLGSWDISDISENVGSNNKVYVIYSTSDYVGNREIRYCNNVAGSWSCSNVMIESTNHVPSALDSNNKVHFSYMMWPEKALGYCNNVAGSWSCSTVESSPPPESCPDNQTILRLSSETNAHGEVWNGTGNYPVKICYDEIFDGQIGSGDRTCSGTNKIIGLSAETNAHGEIPSLSNYATEVCYGDLECSSTTSSCESLGAGYKLIVSLSSDTNAHLSNSSNYPVKICCRVSAEIKEAYWANMANQVIAEADLKDTVKLVVSGEKFGNKEINYTIYKDIWWWFDKKMAQTSSLGFTTWKAGDKGDGTFESGTYYFKAIASDGSTPQVQSDNLEVSASEDNSPPVAIISNPKIGEIYFLNEIIGFNQTSYDKDDFFNYTWNFGDGITAKGSSRNYVNYNTTHAYFETGQKNILLEAKDERGLSDRDMTSILIINLNVDGKYVFAHISKPEWGENIIGSLVDFNANSSYAIEVINGVIKCIAGNCSGTTANGTVILNRPKPLDNMQFNWTFIESSDLNRRTYFVANGSDGAVFTKEFNMPSSPENPHRAILTVSVNPSSTTETEFSMSFTYPFCTIHETNYDNFGWWKQIDSLYSLFRWTSPNYNCYEATGIPVTECCPQLASSCSIETGKCSDTGIRHCSDFSSQSECEADNGHPTIAVPDVNNVLNPKYCGYEQQYSGGSLCSEKILNCRCSWNGTTCNTNYEQKVCKGNTCYNYTNLPGNINEICNVAVRAGECQLDFKSVDNCNTTGTMSISWSFINWTGNPETRPDECKDGSSEFPCLSQALLEFFDLINLAIAIILIIIFYLIVLRKKKKYQKTGKKIKKKR